MTVRKQWCALFLFLFVPACMSIYELVPSGGVAMDEIVIEGRGFKDIVGVTFQGPQANGTPTTVPAMNYTVDSTERIRATVPMDARTGPVAVYATGDQAVSPYNFKIFAIGIDEKEDNNVISRAKSVGDNRWVSGALSGADDEDWFKFTSKNNANAWAYTLDFHVRAMDATDADILIEIVDKDEGTLVTHTGIGEVQAWICLPRDTQIHAKVQLASGDSNVNYALHARQLWVPDAREIGGDTEKLEDNIINVQNSAVKVGMTGFPPPHPKYKYEVTDHHIAFMEKLYLCSRYESGQSPSSVGGEDSFWLLANTSPGKWWELSAFVSLVGFPAQPLTVFPRGENLQLELTKVSNGNAAMTPVTGSSATVDFSDQDILADTEYELKLTAEGGTVPAYGSGPSPLRCREPYIILVNFNNKWNENRHE